MSSIQQHDPDPGIVHPRRLRSMCVVCQVRILKVQSPNGPVWTHAPIPAPWKGSKS